MTCTNGAIDWPECTTVPTTTVTVETSTPPAPTTTLVFPRCDHGEDEFGACINAPTYPETPETTVPDIVPTPTVLCQEDEACWNCETMGNMICGPAAVIPATTDGVAIVAVTPPAPRLPETGSAETAVGLLLASVFVGAGLFLRWLS